MSADLINALFEVAGAILVLLSVRQLHRTSFRSGVCLVAANTVWLAQLLYYLGAEQR